MAPLLASNLVKVSAPSLATHMASPSKAMPTVLLKPKNVPSSVPSLARSLVTWLFPFRVTQIFSPSKARQLGVPGMGISSSTVPPRLTFITESSLLPIPVLATQMASPSKAIPRGKVPTEKVPTT